MTIEFACDHITATVSDNGQGFTINETSEFIRSGKTGIIGMQERARLLGGKLTVSSRPGAGTTVILEVPATYFENQKLEIGVRGWSS